MCHKCSSSNCSDFVFCFLQTEHGEPTNEYYLLILWQKCCFLHHTLTASISLTNAYDFIQSHINPRIRTHPTMDNDTKTKTVRISITPVQHIGHFGSIKTYLLSPKSPFTISHIIKCFTIMKAWPPINLFIHCWSLVSIFVCLSSLSGCPTHTSGLIIHIWPQQRWMTTTM